MLQPAAAHTPQAGGAASDRVACPQHEHLPAGHSRPAARAGSWPTCPGLPRAASAQASGRQPSHAGTATRPRIQGILITQGASRPQLTGPAWTLHVSRSGPGTPGAVQARRWATSSPPAPSARSTALRRATEAPYPTSMSAITPRLQPARPASWVWVSPAALRAAATRLPSSTRNGSRLAGIRPGGTRLRRRRRTWPGHRAGNGRLARPRGSRPSRSGEDQAAPRPPYARRPCRTPWGGALVRVTAGQVERGPLVQSRLAGHVLLDGGLLVDQPASAGACQPADRGGESRPHIPVRGRRAPGPFRVPIEGGQPRREWLGQDRHQRVRLEELVELSCPVHAFAIAGGLALQPTASAREVGPPATCGTCFDLIDRLSGSPCIALEGRHPGREWLGQDRHQGVRLEELV